VKMSVGCRPVASKRQDGKLPLCDYFCLYVALKCEGIELPIRIAICMVELFRSESVSVMYTFMPRQQHLGLGSLNVD
jgi:hypothetical protein